MDRKKIIAKVLIKIAPKQPPKEWWDLMKNKIKKDNPSYSDISLNKIVGDIWYNRLNKSKKKEILSQYEK